MTTQELKVRIDEIKEVSHIGDHEKAHSLEDELYRDVLVAICKGTPNYKQLALMALQTQKLDFSRWCA